MEKIKEYKGIIIIVLVLVLGAFYWFQIRPIQIIKYCSKPKGSYLMQQYIKETNQSEQVYKECLRGRGLNR
jgi:hypothetical protein